MGVCTVDVLMPLVYLDHVTLDFTVLKDQMFQTQRSVQLEKLVHAQLGAIVQRIQHRHYHARWEHIPIKHD